MSTAETDRKRQQVVWTFAVFSSQLKRRDARRVTQESKVDQFIHGLKIESGFFGLGIQMQVLGIHVRDRSVDPFLCLL